MVSSAPTKQASAAAVSKKPSKPLLVRLAPYLVWQVIALLCVELLLYCAGIGEEEIFKLDPDLGTRHMLNKRVTWRSEGYAQSYFNDDGMREPGLTVAKPPNTYRVALLGDSIVEALQVPIEQTFGQLLEKKLSAGNGQKVQFLNFGTSGYSTAQEYLQLKKQVLKYRPDLVALCYDSRDMFENWTPADAVITNVRPVALHLPGGKLVVHSYNVQRWMRSPRARFLNGIEWIRQHSHIWGLIAALDLECSQKNKLWRAVENFLTRPKKAWPELIEALTPKLPSAPSFQIRFFEDTSHSSDAASHSQTSSITAAGQTRSQESVANAKLNSAAPNAVLQKSVKELSDSHPGSALQQAQGSGSASKQVDGKKLYVELVERTMGSLLAEMRDQCRKAGADFVVLIMPSRSALCPAPGMDTEFYDIDYKREVAIVKALCAQNGIPRFDLQQVAETLPLPDRCSLYYAVHLSARGHEFIADSVCDFMRRQMGCQKK